MVLGTIGSERTKSLSVLGDTVNTAARLQALSRELGTSLVASAEVVAAMHREGHPDAAALLAGLKSAGARQVRGRSAATEIWVLDAKREHTTTVGAGLAPPRADTRRLNHGRGEPRPYARGEMRPMRRYIPTLLAVLRR